jgi:MFS superfamily sulfate permease-like transporter
MENTLTVPTEKPRNGLAGLKYWRQDIVAGLVVSLISLPFSLGIAVASGAPPICGLISAIIAGLIFPFLGGPHITISGPAAGLAPVLLASMTLLGNGNLAVGYPLLLGAIFFTGCVQIVLSKLKAANLSAAFPAAVIEGMLASIGLLIIIKQLPFLVGHPYKAHEFWGILAETPHELGLMNPKVFLLGMFCLALVFGIAASKVRWLNVVPPQLTVVVVGLVLGRFLGLDGQYLIHIPDKPFAHGLVWPNFQGLLADHSLWLTVVGTVLTLTMIDGVESLATAQAIDKIDPFRRTSDPNRTLLAMGVSNICSSLAGGLTIIPGGVKSTACIKAGGRTLWANFYNAIFLLIFLFLAKDLINLIPFSALAAILIFTGYKLCEPRVWRHVAHVGREQLLLFSATVLVTLSTDLLMGIAFGLGLKLVMNIAFTAPSVRSLSGRPVPTWKVVLHTLAHVPELFRNPVTRRELAGTAYHLEFGRPVVCFNAVHVLRELERIPSEAESVTVHITDHVPLVDHTSYENLANFAEEFERRGRGRFEIVGLERMRMLSHDSTCTRLGPAPLAHAPEGGLTHLPEAE